MLMQNPIQGANSQNFLGKFLRFFVTLRCYEKWVLYDLYSSLHHPLMIPASKSTLSLNNFKILRPKVKKNLMNLCKKFIEYPRWVFHGFKQAKLAQVNFSGPRENT